MVRDGLAQTMSKSKPPLPLVPWPGRPDFRPPFVVPVPVVVPPPGPAVAKLGVPGEAKAVDAKPVAFSKSAHGQKQLPPLSPPLSLPLCLPLPLPLPFPALPVPVPVPLPGFQGQVKEESDDADGEVAPALTAAHKTAPEEPATEQLEKLRQWSERLKCIRCTESADAKLRRLEEMRAALKADLAREELLAAQATRRAELTHRAEQSQLLRQTAGRVLALDLTSTLRDVRMLSSCGSADALAEALQQLLLTLRRAQQLCRQRHEEEKQLNEEHRELRERSDSEGRQRRLALIRQLAKTKQETHTVETDAKDAAQGNPNYAELVAVCGVPLLAKIAHEASEAGIDILALSTQLSQCVLQGASHLQSESVAAEELRSLMEEAQVQQPPVQKAAVKEECTSDNRRRRSLGSVGSRSRSRRRPRARRVSGYLLSQAFRKGP